MTLTVRDETHIPEITRYLVEQGVNVYAITPGPHITGGDLY